MQKELFINLLYNWIHDRAQAREWYSPLEMSNMVNDYFEGNDLKFKQSVS